MFFRKRAWQSKFTFNNAVTQSDALTACEQAAKEVQLRVFQESPGSLLLSPGFAGKAQEWKRQSLAVLGAGPTAEPKDDKQLLQNQVRMPTGLGMTQIRVELKPGDEADAGVVVVVTSSNVGRFTEFVTALGDRIDEKFKYNPGAHGCTGTLENFLAEACSTDITDRKKLKEQLRKKSLHDWYAAKVAITNFEMGADGAVHEEEEEDEEVANEDSFKEGERVALKKSADPDSFKARSQRFKSLSNWYADGAITASASRRTSMNSEVSEHDDVKDRTDSFQMTDSIGLGDSAARRR